MTQQSNLSPEESLQLINDMIVQAKKDYQYQSFFFLLWGWLLTFTGIAVYIFSPYYPNYIGLLWFAQGIIGGIVASVYGSKKGRQQGKTTSHVNRVILNIWIGFGISLFIVIYSAAYFNANSIPFVLALTGFPTFLTGRIIRFAPLTWGGISFWLFAMISLYAPGELSPLIFSIAILFGYIAPGYSLKLTEKRKISVQRS